MNYQAQHPPPHHVLLEAVAGVLREAHAQRVQHGGGPFTPRAELRLGQHARERGVLGGGPPRAAPPTTAPASSDASSSSSSASDTDTASSTAAAAATIRCIAATTIATATAISSASTSATTTFASSAAAASASAARDCLGGLKGAAPLAVLLPRRSGAS